MSDTGFARAEIRKRMDKLLAELRGTLQKTSADAVHDVRVANRRLRQALRIIGPLLARKQAKRLRAELKPVTEAGGAVRDCDIVMELYSQARVPGQHPLWEELRAERAAAEGRLRKKVARILQAESRQGWSVRLGLDGRAGEGAARLPRVAPLLKEYFEAGRAAARPGSTAEQLHAFRLDTKRLRYTIELYRALYGPGLAARLEDLRRIQELLGQANDHVVAAERLRERARTDMTLQPALAWLENQAKALQASFRRYWRERMDEPGIEVRWTNYLRRRKQP